MPIDRRLYDANLRLLEVELERADFPDEVTWDLRQEMPWAMREQFSVAYQTNAFGGQVKGVLYFEVNPANEVYRFVSFDVELGAKMSGEARKCRFDRRCGVSVGLREGVNLMQGRPVYKDYRNDPNQLGYWLTLGAIDEGLFEAVPSDLEFEPYYALETGMFTKRLGIEACRRIADQLQRGDRVRAEVNGKNVCIEVDPRRRQLVLTNVAGKPVKLNWWEVFVGRK